MLRRRPIVVPAVIAVLLGLLTACGGGGASSGNDNEIVLGSVCSCTGPQSSSLGGVGDAANAWASWVNAHGGINGHQVKLIVKDDGGDPTKSLAAVKELVEQDHVLALVGEQSNVDPSWAGYITQKGIPVVGGNPSNITFNSNADFFPIGTDLISTMYARHTVEIAAGKPDQAAVFCTESSQCAQVEQLEGKVSEIAGNKLVYTNKVSASSPNYTAQCLAARDAKAQSMFVGAATDVVVHVMNDCAQQGFHPLIIGQDGSVTQSWLKEPALDGAKVVETSFPFFDSSTPATQAFQQAIDQYTHLRGTTLYGPNLTYSWLGGKLFEAAAKAGNLGPNSKPADVKTGLYALKNETLDGLAPPLAFTKDKPAGLVSCYFEFSIQGGQFTSAEGLKPSCVDPAKVPALTVLLAGIKH